METTAETVLSDVTSPTTWMRGVNIGGWLLAERFITPYLFAVNTCHLKNASEGVPLCHYPGQAYNESSSSPLCDPSSCKPVYAFRPRVQRVTKAHKELGYPIDEYQLTTLLGHHSKQLAKDYMERHWNNFLTRRDLQQLKQAGVTHLRVPMGYWVRGDILEDEPWVDGGWKHFQRMVEWCREIGGLTVWADLHAAPGSQNGFDNSGKYLYGDTCVNWSSSPQHVDRTLDILEDIAQAIHDDNMLDVVGGVGLLNEPFVDCQHNVLLDFYNRAFRRVRAILPDIAILTGDQFHASRFNDGSFWTTEEHANTFLDTHPYHVFFEKGRALSPKQHIAYVCRYNRREAESCCYQDPPHNKVPSKGIKRITGEWSAAVDSLPTELEMDLLDGIAENGTVPMLERKLSFRRQEFLKHFVQAQMVTYEVGPMAKGWTFWNFKMEGGAFAEWDFLRGIREGWIPALPAPNVLSADLYGTCEEILNRTDDDASILSEFPNQQDLDPNIWQGWDVDDDYVLNHGQIVPKASRRHPFTGVLFLTLLAIGMWIYCGKRLRRRLVLKDGYEPVPPIVFKRPASTSTFASDEDSSEESA